MITLNMIKSAPVGPVAGGIMGCIMVLVLAVYAYRHQIHRRSHQHMSPLAAQGKLNKCFCYGIELQVFSGPDSFDFVQTF